MESITTTLATQYGNFNIKVYKNDPGQESFVLWTDHIDRSKPVLVRVHSECLTGDLLHSLHCDCGKQLKKSLELINANEGVLIYLRQEGRGIGLFEKMKAYKLQKEGYDTSEANILLGFKPDQRSYEMAKVILDDLGIKKIKLLTNNPNKISELAKLGIDVRERIPLIIKSNKINKFYFVTKKQKFQHFFGKKSQHYFYQFHATLIEHIEQIHQFIKPKKKDPLLKIYVGLSGDEKTFQNEDEINQIQKLCITSKSKNFEPVLHFSFSQSTEIPQTLEKIKNHLPFINHLQINDLSIEGLMQIEKYFKFFTFDIPLSDETFEIIHNKKFRNLVKKYHSFILLDNSKGKGLQESKESLSKKINILLNYGINNIGILGGFGPNNLNVYFELRRYFKLNFSIDAETNLKTNTQFDMEKTRNYLFQLLRFDDPNEESIHQTMDFVKNHYNKEWGQIEINNNIFKIHPEVFRADLFPSTKWYSEIIPSLIKNDEAFCEVGCGSGIISCVAALSNPQLKVLATDINPDAIKNSKLNAQRLGIQDRIKILKSDVLDSIKNKVFFDKILWLLPFGYLDPGTKINLQQAQFFDPGYTSIRKFLFSCKNFLKTNGEILIGFSPELGNLSLLLEIAKEANIQFSIIAETKLQETNSVTFQLLSGKYKTFYC
jgi:GTP cyclohydrolase II